MRTRKFVVSLPLATTLLASLAGGAGAAPDENANCVKDGGLGVTGTLASTDCGGR